MDLKILGIFGQDTNDERLTLDVLNDCNIKNYIIMDTTYDDDESISNKWRHALHLPDIMVKKGDQVKIYTRKGKNRTVRAKSNACDLHFVYWGLDGNIWNKEGDIAYLYEIADYNTYIESNKD